MPSLYDLAALLRAYAAAEVPRGDVERWLDNVLAADPLGAERSDAGPWDDGHEEERLLWRLAYLVESSGDDDEALRHTAGRLVACLASTASAADTFELLPIVLDQDRLCTIVDRRRRGIISRTGFLSVLAESGYPAHAKLWLEHADAAALDALCARLGAAEYGAAARMLERAPD